jgi:hypothetical protein
VQALAHVGRQDKLVSEDTPISTEDRLVAILEKMSGRRERPGLNLEKVVAAVIMLIVVSACGWVGTTLNETTSTVLALELELNHMNVTVSELKTELAKRRDDRDTREEKYTTNIANLERRVLVLESKAGN